MPFTVQTKAVGRLHTSPPPPPAARKGGGVGEEDNAGGGGEYNALARREKMAHSPATTNHELAINGNFNPKASY